MPGGGSIKKDCFGTQTNNKPQPTPQPQLPSANQHVSSLFLGTWLNSSSTESITKVIVSPIRQGLFQIHFFGSCVPTYCDWGVTRGYYNDKVIQGTYQFDFKTTKFTLSLTDDGKLEVLQVNYYNDGRPNLTLKDMLRHA